MVALSNSHKDNQHWQDTGESGFELVHVNSISKDHQAT